MRIINDYPTPFGFDELLEEIRNKGIGEYHRVIVSESAVEVEDQLTEFYEMVNEQGIYLETLFEWMESVPPRRKKRLFQFWMKDDPEYTDETKWLIIIRVKAVRQ